MAYKSGFFDAVATAAGYSPTYNSSDFSTYFSAFISNGVFPNSTNSAMQVTAGTSGLTVTVGLGVGIISGRFINNYSDTTVTLATADKTYGRIDNIVMELDMTIPSFTLTSVQGTPSANPVAPNLVSTSAVTQLCLAQVLVPANATTIAVKNITDTRSNNNVCGWASASAGEASQLNSILSQVNKIYKVISEGVPVMTSNSYTNLSSESVMSNLAQWTLQTGSNGSLTIYGTEVVLTPGQLQVLTFPTAFNKYCYPMISPSGVQASNGNWEVPSADNMEPYGNNACVPSCSTSQITLFNPWGLTGAFFVTVIGE